MSKFVIRQPDGFSLGLTSLTHIDEADSNTGIHFAILKLSPGEEFNLQSKYESAYLLIQGRCEFHYENVIKMAERHSCFDEEPYAIHLSSHAWAKIKAITACEFAVSQVENHNQFETQFFDQTTMLESEKRGKGLLDDTACRIVRTIFDIRNRPDAKLVLGEVVTQQGRWSSYPPHHHEHPEIYHYRFTEPQGYGHAECGDDVFKIRQYDTYKILQKNDHAQTAAPGYGMYYIWVIRHLDNNPYQAPEFVEEHSWTKSAEANSRVWRGNF